MVKLKTCSKCGKEKPLRDFYSRKRSKDGRRSWCKNCTCTYNKSIGKNAIRQRNLKRKFDITLDDYDRMLKEQNGQCAICERHWSKFKRRLAVHHDHITDEVLGLLCPNCNTLLGRIEKAEETGIMAKMNIFRGKS